MLGVWLHELELTGDVADESLHAATCAGIVGEVEGHGVGCDGCQELPPLHFRSASDAVDVVDGKVQLGAVDLCTQTVTVVVVVVVMVILMTTTMKKMMVITTAIVIMMAMMMITAMALMIMIMVTINDDDGSDDDYGNGMGWR